MSGSGSCARARAHVRAAISRTSARVVLLALGVALVASMVVPALASAESAPKDTSRPPHTSAPPRPRASGTADAVTAARVAAYVGAVQRNAIAAYVAAAQGNAIGAYITAAQSAAAAQQATPRHAQSQATTPVHAANGSSPGGFLACVRQRESGGDYGAVNRHSGTAGAYQFMPGTWNSTASSAGRPDLVGVNPAAASPADQDAMAQHLYATRGASPWSTGRGC
jgi:hypothetical protein